MNRNAEGIQYDGRMGTVRAYLRAFRSPFTYDLRRNVYMGFGFIWGVPVPFFSVVLDLTLSPELHTPWEVIVQHPVHLFFLAHPLLFAGVFGAMGTVRRELELENLRLIESLTNLATTDVLTGLHNRRYVLDELSKAIQRSNRTGHPFALVLFDLDGFKAVNDTRGHSAGDLILKDAAVALQEVVREGDVLGRYGGDEFLLVTYGDLDSLMTLAGRADQAIARRTGLGVSAGVSRFPEDGADIQALIDLADGRMVEDKKRRYTEKGTSRRDASPK
jgi:diguanylate cyclase (GGDEF)-like protein